MALIEDDQRIRAALVRSLAARGHTVRAAGRAMEGLTQVLEWHPDVVVLDLGLPDLDGTELLKMIRAVSAVPVIVATARDDEAEIVRALDSEGAPPKTLVVREPTLDDVFLQLTGRRPAENRTGEEAA